ncbi:hypothetical protein ABT59_09610 [Enterococcus cecorum]|nr:hypothetical protein ABT59_09610 [Enterococcus cecorum]KLN92571.1 hypothetical protein ABT60_08975 [Enterococcus cecorum]
MADIIRNKNVGKPLKVAAVISLTIEIIQNISCKGYFELLDIFTNVLGSYIGIKIFHFWKLSVFKKSNVKK